ncbi:MAG: hypothetical protein A3H35_11955 [Betaproteobacteria bacterium RIFCSPLOWO2_02_FULL_62_17]|nr:MAG: hypothetical protein A3H35_11955 [Betaproteobacteria bacterium RIFCSPLOWO2_02_FULL_62_17]
MQKLALAGADTLVLLGVFALLGFPLADDVPAWVRYDIKTLAVHCALVAITVGWFWTGLEHYARRRPFWDELRDILRTLSFMFLLAGATVFYAGLDAGRGTYLWVWAFTFVLLPLARAVAKAILEALDLWQRPAVILGTGQNARDACLALKSEHGMGYRIDAFIELENDNAANSERIEMEGEAYPILAPRNGLEALLAELGKPQLILALETLSTPKMQTLVQQLAATEHNIHVIPAIRGLPLFGTQLSHFFSHQVLFLTIRNNLSRRSYRWTKRLFDLVAASALLVLLSPVLLALAILIRRTGGTALYSHTRIGRDGRPFQCLKFRSMRPDADRVLEELLAKDAQARSEWEKDLKLKNDPRVTALGRFLRKTSLDELPQLINVIKGEMSLVGPRPIVSEELQRYGECAMLYLQVLPGITGLWQISGRNDTSYAERVSLDAWYVQNWSLWYDIAILFKTVNVVLNRRGAY